MPPWSGHPVSVTTPFALSSSDRLVQVLRTIVRTLIIDVLSRQAKGSNRDMIGSEFIGCDALWHPPVLLQQFPHQLQSRPGVPFGLHKKIQNLAFIVDGTL